MGALPHDAGLVGRATAPALDRATPAVPAGELCPGTVLGGRYELLARRGAGGMGAVYEAVQRGLDRRVAVKVLSPLLATDPEARRRFTEEGRVASRVRHPNVVEVFDQGIDGSTPYLVMELLEGEPLAARMERVGRFAPQEAVALLAPVLRALAYLHKRGVVHRDLKPDNLFLARDGDQEDVPRILDLGIAVALGDASQRLTGTGVMLGTPAYMSPEQIRSARDVTGATDQYAIACVLYEMLTGRLPVEADSVQGVLAAKLVCDPTPVSGLLPRLTPRLAEALMRALSRDPAARFADPAAFLAALEAGLRAPPQGPSAGSDPDAPLVPLAARPEAPDPSPPTQRPPWLAAAGLGVVTAAAVLATLLLRAPRGDRSAPPSTPRPAARVAHAPTARPVAPTAPPAQAPTVTTPTATAPRAAPPPASRPRRRAVSDRLSVDPENPLRARRP